MNLEYVKNFLTTKKDNMTKEDIDSLLSEINSYLSTKNTLGDISQIMRVINEYNLMYINGVESYNAIPKGREHILEKTDKAREILCTLSTLHTYITISISNISENTYELKGIRKYLTDLSEKKEHFKSEKMAWITILKSLTQESNFYIEMRRLDLEHEFGFLSTKQREEGSRG